MLNVICALLCEAKPLLAFLKLKAHSIRSPFPIYQNEETRLVISGVGKVNAAAAASYVQGLFSDHSHQAWMNVGTAGCRNREIGEGFLANAVTDFGTAKRYYPGMGIFEERFPSLPIVTVDLPREDCKGETLYEMEASGFFSAASRFSSVEWIHCYKVISDHCDSPLDHPKPQVVEQLIENRLSTIDRLMTRLKALLDEHSRIHRPSRYLETFLHRWHFTRTQAVQLERLLKQWETCVPPQFQREQQFDRCKNAGDVLRCLQDSIRSQPLRF